MPRETVKRRLFTLEARLQIDQENLRLLTDEELEAREKELRDEIKALEDAMTPEEKIAYLSDPEEVRLRARILEIEEQIARGASLGPVDTGGITI